MKVVAGSTLVLCASLCSAPAVESQSPVGAPVPAEPRAVSAGQRPSPGAPARAELEVLFWQSILNSTDPADFEAYLAQYPNGVFRRLAQIRLSALRSPSDVPVGASGRPARPASGSRVSPAGGSGAAGPAGETVVDPGPRPGDVFRDCDDCPEMVVLPGGDVALGRYEVTVGEYRSFGSAAGGSGEGCGSDGGSWEDPGFRQTDRHPVTCVSWDDAQAYVSWLSRTTGATYRLPTEAEWELAAVGSQAGCSGRLLAFFGGSGEGTCRVGFYGANAAGLSDMVGNVWEWTSDCFEPACDRRVLRGGSWINDAANLRPGTRFMDSTAIRNDRNGFRVSRTLD